MKPTVIYIAGFRQHAGKTVTSLGLLSLLLRKYSPKELGYIKPVGQELVELEDGSKIDKDARIIEKFAGIPDLEMKYVSPVRLGSGFTKAFLASDDQDKRSTDLAADIHEAFASMSHKKVIVAEGTGHPGVGGIVGLSNADVCNSVGCDIVYLSGGGIGKALDMLEVDLSYFAYKGARVKGIVFNKLIPEKINTVKTFITETLINQKFDFPGGPTRVLGYLPEIENLYKPSMRVLADRFSGPEIIGDLSLESWKVPAKEIRVISITLEYLHLERYISARDLVIIGGASEDRINRLIEYHQQLIASCDDADDGSFGGCGLAGIVISCSDTTTISDAVKKKISEADVPALFVTEDTATTEKIILKAFESTKMQIFDTVKYREIENLFAEHFEYDKFLDTFGL